MKERRSVQVEGIVQGVGFRPFVHAIARERSLCGWVRNATAGVEVEVEGRPSDLDDFVEDLRSRAPPLARVERVEVKRMPPRGDEEEFRIQESRKGAERLAYVPPDTATCDACLRELFDPDDRRYLYPFLNCTRCGPRLTIVRDLPYDRPRTTMAGFPMCSPCRAEYEDPADRRYHAQPTACPDCGPRLGLLDGQGRAREGEEPLPATVAALRRGEIAAVKGLGGYHLACDARNGEAVARLRRRKHREAKPLAVMAADLETARSLCRVGEREAELLTSPRRPIVLMRKRDGAPVAGEVAPRNRHLGVMLPYTPLHHLLLSGTGRPLVMTSGNRTDEPIAYRDGDAVERLSGIADLFLTHDRPIEMRCDDSVTRVLCGAEVPVRRSRGYAPEPVRLPVRIGEGGRAALAVGGHLKNTFCFTRGRQAFLSHHVGDLENLEACRALETGIEHYRRLFEIEPEIVAHDLHPDYLSTKLAEKLDVSRRTGVQHHHAHVAACLAEHGAGGPAIGVAFDGTGFGTDGAVWGGEVLVADLAGFERRAHLGYVPLPGGEAAVREPWRTATAHLFSAFGPDLGGGSERLRAGVDPDRWEGVLGMLAGGVGSPPTSSVGRLFDAVAALLGLRTEVEFEAQAAMELEAEADPAASGSYPVRLVAGGDGKDGEDGGGRGPGAPRVWDPGPVIAGVVEDVEAGRPASGVAGRFHRTVAAAVEHMCTAVREGGGPDRVALTGGVFQNALLTELTVRALEGAGFRVLLHRKVPPNDGGLAYGQAAVALARAAEGGGPGRPEGARRRPAVGTETQAGAGRPAGSSAGDRKREPRCV